MNSIVRITRCLTGAMHSLLFSLYFIMSAFGGSEVMQWLLQSKKVLGLNPAVAGVSLWSVHVLWRYLGFLP